jgi:hypothetical protein
LSENEDELSRNDTVQYIQVLSNYYALDDGTPEARISINNNGGGFAAQRFDCYLSDSLKAVQLFFNRTVGDLSGQTFYLMIWSAGSNAPGNLIYEQEVNYPANQGLNAFATIALDSAIYIPSGTYYIGWAQTTNFDINVGFDRNFNNNSRIYYNLDGNWYNYDAQEGTMMIRPLFRYPNDIYVGTSASVTDAQINWTLFPNPTSGLANIHFSSEIAANVILMDVSGRILRNESSIGQQVELSVVDLPAGIYLVGVKTSTNQSYQFRKLIISNNR